VKGVGQNLQTLRKKGYKVLHDIVAGKFNLDHGPGGICDEGKECKGHFKGDIPARVISRMLYVTLPELGLLPLTKHDLKEIAVEVYGRDSEKQIALALQVLREDRAIDETEFHILFPLPEEGFPDEEILSALRRVLTWTHFKTTIYPEDPLKRDFYSEMCRLERWNTLTLAKKISGMLFVGIGAFVNH
jgi:hypothetical protein